MKGDNKSYKKLIVWQKADDLAFKVYQVTKDFPKEEIYGMTSQIRRSVLSVPTNIVEGCGRQGQKELKNFVNIALGSLVEFEYLWEFSRRLNYVISKDFEELEQLRDETGALLWKFYQSL